MKIAIFPARGGSERIKSKNIVDFFGKPIIHYALDAAKKSGLFDKIHVSTDSDEIIKKVEELGYNVDFKRSPDLADNVTGIAKVLCWVLDEYAKRGEKYDDICCIMPAAPLLEANDLVEAYEIFKQHDKKRMLLAMTKFPVPVEWAFRRDKTGIIEAVSAKALNTRSQDLKDAYYEAGPYSFFHSSHLKGEIPPEERQFVSHVIPKDRSVDIDEPEDLEFAKTLYLGKLEREKNR